MSVEICFIQYLTDQIRDQEQMASLNLMTVISACGTFLFLCSTARPRRKDIHRSIVKADH